MQHTTKLQSPGAMGLGVLFTAVTGYVLLEDVIHGAAFGTAHALTVAAIIGTIAAGHMAWPRLLSGHIVAALGLCLMFAAGTTYVVISAGARNAEVQARKSETIRQNNADRDDIVRQIADARQRLAEAQKALESECGTGKGKRCEGRTLTVEERADRLGVLEAKLRLAGPRQAENAGYAHAAAVLAALPFVVASSAEIEARLTLLMPFLLVLVAEIGTLVFWSVAFQSVPRPNVGPKTALAPRNDNPPGDKAPVETPDVPDLPVSDADRVLDWSTKFREKHGRFPSQAELRNALDLPKTTCWRLYHELGLAA